MVYVKKSKYIIVHDYLFTTIMVKGLKKIIDMGLNKLIKHNINK